MKFINYTQLNGLVGGYYINPFDLDNAKDQLALEKIMSAIYAPHQLIFIVCHGHSKIKSDVSDKISQMLGETSESIFIGDRLSGLSGYTIRTVAEKNTTLKLLTLLWRSFQELRFFAPAHDLQWNSFISYDCNLFQQDVDGKRMFAFDFTDCLFLKGAGGESLSINHKQNFKLPELKNILAHK